MQDLPLAHLPLPLPPRQYQQEGRGSCLERLLRDEYGLREEGRISLQTWRSGASSLYILLLSHLTLDMAR